MPKIGKDPAFLFYTSDFYSGISDLTMEERGQYITLLCLQHLKGHLSDKAVKLAVGNPSPDVMAKFKKDSDGLWYNERLNAEVSKRRAFSERQSENAKKRWKKSHSDVSLNEDVIEDENENENENERHVSGISQPLSQSDAKSMPRHNHPIRSDSYRDGVLSGQVHEAEVWPTFKDFWEEYDKKAGNQRTLSNIWNRIPQDQREAIMEYLPKYKISQPNKKYRKNPFTFLVEEGWKDELTLGDEQRDELIAGELLKRRRQ
jgi:hypothetical protein